ncbi:MAG TPA: hypothetical protein VGE35_03440 [Candidatus Paceibacterota bacterium]
MNAIASDKVVTEQGADAIYYFFSVPSHYGERELKALDLELNERACAAISQDYSRGIWSYKPDGLGLYEARQLQNLMMGRVAAKVAFTNHRVTLVRKEFHSNTGAMTTEVCLPVSSLGRLYVDRSRDTLSMLTISGREVRIVDDSILDDAPHGEGETVEVLAFEVGGHSQLTHERISREYDIRGLYPADPHSLAAATESSSANGPRPRSVATHWIDPKSGQWCRLIVSQEHGVSAGRTHGTGIHSSFWLAGIAKERR